MPSAAGDAKAGGGSLTFAAGTWPTSGRAAALSPPGA
jgi:hypothetical protein